MASDETKMARPSRADDPRTTSKQDSKMSVSSTEFLDLLPV